MNSQPAKGGNQVIGVVLVVLGALFLLGQFMDIGNIIGNWGWPFFIIIPGVLLLAAAFVNKSAAGLAIPGSIVTTVGLILFFQNATDHFESWAYAWGLVVAASGLGRFIQGVLTNNENSRNQGWRTVLVGAGLFVVLGVFFEMFIFNENKSARYLVPLALIVLGVYLLMRRPARHDIQLQPKSEEPKTPPQS